METLGLSHLGLAVSNLQASTEFFTQALGWKIAREVPEYPARFVTNGHVFFTLWQTDANANAFNRRSNVVLHHVAIKVPTEEALEAVFKKVSAHPGVNVEFSPEFLRGGPARHCMIFEPSGIRVEFVWSP